MANIVTEPKPRCPDCGAEMMLIQPGVRHRTKWAPFWCCSRPGCKGVRDIDPETGEPERRDGEDDPSPTGPVSQDG